MKRLLLVFGLLAMVSQIEAQSKKPTDVVKFKDNGEFRGEIIEYKKGEYLKMDIGGRIETIDGDQLQNIKDIGFDKLDYYSNHQSFWYELQLSLNMGKSNSWSSTETMPQVGVAAGYQFHPLLGVGIGSGYQVFSNVKIIPVYASFRGDFFENRITPFYYADLGYGIGMKRNDTFFADEKTKGGLLMGTGLGLRLNFKRTYLSTSLGFRYQAAAVTRDFQQIFFDTRFGPGGEETFVENRKYKRAELKVSIGF